MAIKARAQKTLTKVFDGSGVFSIIITNENTSIPISNQGLPLNYSSTPTDAYVYSGTSLLTPVSSNPEAGQYTLTAAGENISAGLVTINGNHASVANASNMSVGKDTYSITLTASGKDFLGNPFSAQKKQVITPLKRGDDATSYWENVSSSVITKDVKGNMTPDSTTVSAVYQSGMADPDSYSGIFKVYLKSGVNFSTTPDYTSSAPEQLYKIIPKSDTNDIKVELYDATGTNLLDIQTVPVISQANGVISTKIVYTVTSSQVQPNDSANWSDTIPTVGKGQYLWTKTTFYYTDGSNAVAYSMGSNGKDGSSAALLTLTADSQIVTFDSDGSTPIPAAQTITLTAILQNLTGTATFVATPYSGDAAGTPITLGGTGNVRTITASQFGSQYDSVSVKATLGELSDTETIHKLTKGENGDPGPKGADGTDGKNGTDGAPGPKGADGRTSYVHVAYANSADGTSGFSTTDATGKSYVGVYTDFTAADSTTPSVYTWSLIKGSDGKDGSDGIQGPKGADGISTYVHFAYANSSDGKTNFSVTDPTGRAYVGTLTDTTVADSTDPTKYTWSLIKGADGTDGKNGVNSYSGWLTNESITLQADSNGNVPSFTSATGSFVVYNGLTQVTGLTVTQANASGITVSITGMNYSVTGMSSDNGYVDLSITTNGITIIKRLTVAKSKAGATGANGTSVVNSTTPPSNPAEGQWWNDLSVTPNILKVYQKGSWIPYRIDAINLVAGSVKADNLAADVLLASNVKYTNSNGTTTNLQTFDFDGIKTLLSDNNGNTYSSMDTAVSSTQSWTSLSKQVNDLGQVNQLFNTEFSPDFQGWNVGTPNTSGKFTATTPLSSDSSWSLSSEKFNGSNVLLNTYGSGASSINSGLIPIGGSVLSIVALEAYSSSNYNGTVTASLRFYYYDSNQNYISNTIKDSSKVSSWTRLISSATSPSNAAYVVVAFVTNGSVGTSSYSQPMMVFSGSIGDYVQGNYNNNDRILKIEESASQFKISIGQDVKKAQDSADTANTNLSNLSVGGRNYVLNSSAMGAMGGSDRPSLQPNGVGTAQSGATIFYGDDSIALSYTGNGTQEWYYALAEAYQTYASSNLDKTKQYTLSVDVKGTASSAAFRVNNVFSPSVSINSNTWTTLTYTFTFPALTGANVDKYYIRLNATGGNFTSGMSLRFRNFKLEEGNKATDWTPAPEDVQSGINAAQAGVNTLSQVNLINNSDFAPDLGGWTQNNNGANGNYTTGDYDYFGGVYVLESTTTGMARTNSAPIPINSLSPVSFSFNFYIFTLPSGGSVYSQLTYLDANYNEINDSGYPGGINLASGNATGKWINRTVNNLSFTPPTNAKYLVFSFDVRGKGTKAGFNRPILVKGATVGNYVKGDYGMSTATTLKLTADNYTLGIDANGNLISGITGNSQSLSLKGATIYLDAKTVIADDFTTRLLSAYDATIGNTLTIGTGGSIQSALSGKIWDFTPNSGYYLVDNTNPWFQVDQTGTFIMNSLGDLEFNGTITAPDKGKLPDGSTPYAYPTQTTDGSTTVTWTNKLTTTTSLGIQGLRVDQENYNNPASSGGFVYVTGHGIFTGMDQVNPRGVMTPDGSLYVDTINLNSGYSWKTTQVPTAVGKIYQGVFSGTANMYLDAAGYMRLSSNGGDSSGSKIYVQNGGIALNTPSGAVVSIGHNSNGYIYYETQKMGSGGSAVKMASDGAFFAQTSATKYKTNIEYDTTSKLADRLMTLDLASWNDKSEEEMRTAYKNYGDEPDYAIDLDGARYVGLIAEDLVKANLEEFVVRDPRDGTVESIEYDKIGIALIPAIRQQREMINDLRLEVERLKDKINE